jgi:hypothetical protein
MKRILHGLRKIIKVIVLLCLTVGCIYIFNLWVTPTILGREGLENFCRPRQRVPFDVKKWLSAETDATVRYMMANDLVATRLLRELPVGELYRLLGPPEFADTRVNSRVLYYKLASQKKLPAKSRFYPNRFANFDTWYLEVEIRHERVRGLRIRYV